MIIDKETIVYVGCPAYNKTGGTELAHQLVKEICNEGKEAYILYYDIDDKNFEKHINPAFRGYVSTYKILSEVIDCSNNILVVPEIVTDILSKYSQIQKSIWWMSVDNYVKTSSFLNSLHFYGPLGALKNLVKRRVPFFEKSFDKGITHLYQSEYAHIFLQERGITKVHRLSDYLNEVYLNTNVVSREKRFDNVLYNPRKGAMFTEKLKNAAPDLKWIPIENMTNDEVRQLLLTSKVYVDFGNHPGKDRFPREAAISGCCVITGKRGSAANSVDICIPDGYKFDETNITLIIDRIRKCIKNYNESYKDFDGYRERILLEKNEFIEDVRDLFK